MLLSSCSTLPQRRKDRNVKRFFCNTCQHIKRVRRIPKNVEIIFGTDRDGNQVVTGYSPGDCDYHNKSGKTNRELRHGAPVKNRVVATKTPPPPPQRSKRR
jgi:hypothetical protein